MLKGYIVSKVWFRSRRLFLRRRLSFRSRRSGVGRHISRSRLTRNVGTTSLGLLVLLGALVIFPVIHREDKAEATFTPSTTTLNIVSGRSSANVNVKPVSDDGTFAASDDNDAASFDVITNNYSGYVLKLKANEATGGLINSDSSASIGSISNPADAAAFISDPTGAYTNKWGIKPSMVNSALNLYYLPAPINTGDSSTTTEIMMDSTSVANPTVAKNYTVGVGTKVDYTKPIGTYTNTYTVVAVGNPATYTVNYSLGSISGVSGTVPSPTIGSATSSSSTTATVTLASSSLSRTGYNFAGWCYGTLEGTAANPGSSCNGTLVTDRTLNLDLNQTVNNVATVYATWTANKYTITVKPGSNISISLNGSQACSNTSSGCSVSDLVYNNSYSLVATPATGYELNSWSPGSYGSIANTSATTTTYTVGAGASTITATAKAKTYAITLSNSGATTAGSTSTTATYNGGVTSITNPQKKYTASGFTYTTNNASGATVTNPGTKTYTYTFKGWYTTTSSDVKVINSNGTLVTGVSGYTDSNGKWIKDGTATLYAQWSDGTNVTLPSISKQGHSCGWTTTSSGATTIGYTSGGSYKLSSNLTLYGVCIAQKYPCTNRYYLQNTTGATTQWLGPYTVSGYPKDVTYGTSCAYGTSSSPISMTNYKASTSTTAPSSNDATAYTSCIVGTSGCTNTLYFHRNTFAVTLTKAGLVSSVSGGGTKRYGDSVTVTAVIPGASNFLGWKLNNSSGAVQSSSTSYTFTVTAPKTLYVDADRPAIASFTRSNCSSRATGKQIWVEDTRDNQYYTVTYAGGACWMTRNLAIGCAGSGNTYSASRKNVSLTTSNSDVNSTHNTSEFSNMNSDNTSATSGYTTAAMKCDASKGAWYNYKAATATTISGKALNNSTYSICPKNWKLSTLDQIINLMNDTTYRSNFTRVTGGVYHTGELKYTGTGYWWSRTNYDEGKFYDVRWTSETHLTNDQWFQYVGEYVRCIR